MDFRYAPQRPFPPYRFLPGGEHPHPEKAGGYHGDQKPGPSAPVIPETLPAHPDYLYSLDLFNHRYYWEAHVWLEALWHQLGRKGEAADFLKALIKICAAAVKQEMSAKEAAKGHLARALELLEKAPPLYLGLDVPPLGSGTCPSALRLQEECLSLGGGCFWGVQHALSLLPGVLQTTCGYQGGDDPTPSYERVCRGNSGHAEVVLVRFAPSLLPLPRLMAAFLIIHDPTQGNRQGPDVGSQYRSAVFCQNGEQLSRVRSYLDGAASAYSLPLTTQSAVNTQFTPAEEYHQDYLGKTPGGYCHISGDVFERIREGRF